MPRSTFLRALHAHLSRAAEGRSFLCPIDKTGYVPLGATDICSEPHFDLQEMFLGQRAFIYLPLRLILLLGSCRNADEIALGLNIMDLPFISSFVQSSIDAALAEYVAPKSLTLDLKDMLVGDDFKKDTATRGVVVVKINRGRNFKPGDPGLGILKKASSDAYVAVGWAKFGKPVWSTRVIVSDMEPVSTSFVPFKLTTPFDKSMLS